MDHRPASARCCAPRIGVGRGEEGREGLEPAEAAIRVCRTGLPIAAVRWINVRALP
jgi:hypothetical protein